MQKLNITTVKLLLSVLLSGFIYITANAQKLPAVQQASLRAPANLKIDGKATEWGNKFQAYNRHTDFYYTIANNDSHLYLTIQATAPDIIKRIINGGISLTVNKSGKKGDKHGTNICYPIFDKNNRFGVNFKNMPEIKEGSAATVLAADSFMNATNKSMAAKSKLIRVTGIKNVDTLISIYNTDGIKVAALFDNKLVYTLELSVALKQLDLSVTDPVKFSYQLMINEVAPVTTTNNEGSSIAPQITAQVAKMTGSTPARRPGPTQMATDFWGEYTLAK